MNSWVVLSCHIRVSWCLKGFYADEKVWVGAGWFTPAWLVAVAPAYARRTSRQGNMIALFSIKSRVCVDVVAI